MIGRVLRSTLALALFAPPRPRARARRGTPVRPDGEERQPGLGLQPRPVHQNVRGTLFFSADDGVTGGELWMSDGTPAGTVMVLDINPGPPESFPSSFTNVAGTLFLRR